MATTTIELFAKLTEGSSSTSIRNQPRKLSTVSVDYGFGFGYFLHHRWSQFMLITITIVTCRSLVREV